MNGLYGLRVQIGSFFADKYRSHLPFTERRQWPATGHLAENRLAHWIGFQKTPKSDFFLAKAEVQNPLIPTETMADQPDCLRFFRPEGGEHPKLGSWFKRPDVCRFLLNFRPAPPSKT